MRVFNFIFYSIPPKNDKCGKKKQPFQDAQHVKNDGTSADKQRIVNISTTKSRTKQFFFLLIGQIRFGYTLSLASDNISLVTTIYAL